MAGASRGDVWLVDLGMVAKVRPCLLLSEPAADRDRALVTIVPHTTSVRGTQFETVVSSKFLKSGAFDTQNPITVSQVKLLRKLGELSAEDLTRVQDSLRKWLGL